MADNPNNIVPDNLIVIEGGKQLVPAPAPSDAGKVLGVVNSSGDIGWVEDQGGTLTQVQADWAESDPSKVSFIDNKPTIPSKTSDLQNDSGFITSSDIPAIPTKTSDLQNDSGFITSSDIPTKTSELQNDSGFITSSDIPAQVQSNWNESNSSSAAYIQNKPSIPSKTSDLQNDSGFITSSDIPAIPTKTSDLQNDSGFITSSDIPAQVQSDWNEADSNSAAYIKNKPTIPPGVTVDQTYNASSTNAQSGTAVAEAIANIPAPPTYSEGDGIDIMNNVVSADVDGVTIGIDSTTHKIKSLQTIPTKTSDLQNDSGFITSSDIPAIPTKTSDLQNDSGFITSSDIPAQVQANWNESNSSSAAYIQNKPTIPTVDQTYNASSTNAQSGVAVASAVAGVNAVPASTSADEDKVLTVDSNGSPVWAASAVPASKPLVQGSGITITDGQNDVTISADVDQTYSASSTNAQSGVAVASAIAGINAVPASTSADEDKVLTVNSSGTPVWAAAQGGGGSGGDSEFPYDPGYMHTDWGKMVVRFSDTTYDPTTKPSAAYFQSITPLNEPGVYEYDLTNPSGTSASRIFANEWNDYSNNIVDVLQFTPNDSYFAYSELFYNCSGLRSVWNWRGEMGGISDYFYGCPNLEIVDSKASERWVSLTSSGYLSSSVTDFGVQVKTARALFKDCPNLKQAKIIIYVWDFNNGSAWNACNGLKKLEVGPFITGQCTLTNCYYNCQNMTRIYGRSDFPALDFVVSNDSWDYPNHVFAMDYAFQNCAALTDLNGWRIGGAFNYLEYAFSGSGITEAPFIRLAQTGIVQTTNAFADCKGLKKVPLLDYAKITNAGYMFSGCSSLTDVSPLTPLASNCTNVNSLIGGCVNVITGALDLYTALSGSQTITSHTDTFSGVGSDGWNDQRSQIPSSWGGTGA